MRHILFASVLALIPAIAEAQQLEVGATIAAGCLGSDGSICGTGTHPMPAAHVSFWLGERVEVSARVARVGLPEYRATFGFPRTLTYEVTDRARDFVSGLVVYHFRRGKPVRPMLGLGYGAFGGSERIACDPPDCGSVIGGPREGHQRRWMKDAIVVAGLSGRVSDRWVLRGGFLAHRLFNDENSTIELFAGAGYRF